MQSLALLRSHYLAYRSLITLVTLSTLMLLLASGSANAQTTKSVTDVIDVEFSYSGKDYRVQGKSISKNAYVFNAGATKKVSLTTLDWAPYIGQNICKQGWVQQLTIALLASQGYEITVNFFPWARTITMAEKGRVDILYPEYFIEPSAPSDVIKNTKRLDHLALSNPIPGGPIALLKRKDFNTPFKGGLSVLKGANIGVVRGYQNTPKFDALMDSDFFNIDQSTDDVMNAVKLSKKRIDYIIGDPSVIFFSVKNRSSLSEKMRQEIIDSIEVIDPPLQYNPLYYAISKKNPEWKTLLKTLNQAIDEFQQADETQRIINNTQQSCQNAK